MMTGKVRGKAPSQDVVLLCFSTALLVLNLQQQATASSVPVGTNPTSQSQPEHLSPIEELQLPPLKKPTLERPSGATDSTSAINKTSLVIKLSQRRVFVYQNNQLKASYPIAVGKAGWETPTGHYQVIDMQRNPAWQHPLNGKVIPPGPDNPLGERWIAFWTDGRDFIGFHGTPE